MSSYKEYLEDNINLSFPDFPMLSQRLDDGLQTRLGSLLDEDAVVNPMYVEDLLRDCTNRVIHLLQLRDRAYEIETRAIADALMYNIERAAATSQKEIATAMADVSPLMVQNATEVKTEPNGKIAFRSDPQVWKGIAQSQEQATAAWLGALEARRSKALTLGNGSNYIERFSFLKQLFDQSIVEAYQRARTCRKALKSIYGIDLPLPNPYATTPSFLDAFALWAQKASDELSNELDKRYNGEIGFSLNAGGEVLGKYDLLPTTVYESQLSQGKMLFALKQSHFADARMTAVLLRSVRLQMMWVDSNANRTWSTQITLPGSTDEVFHCVSPGTYQDTAESPAVVKGVHNINPVGNWQIEFADKALTGDKLPAANKSAVLKNIILFVDVSYRRP